MSRNLPAPINRISPAEAGRSAASGPSAAQWGQCQGLAAAAAAGAAAAATAEAGAAAAAAAEARSSVAEHSKSAVERSHSNPKRHRLHGGGTRAPATTRVPNPLACRPRRQQLLLECADRDGCGHRQWANVAGRVPKPHPRCLAHQRRCSAGGAGVAGSGGRSLSARAACSAVAGGVIAGAVQGPAGRRERAAAGQFQSSPGAATPGPVSGSPARENDTRNK